MLARRQLTYILMGLAIFGAVRSTDATPADPKGASGAVSLEEPVTRDVFRALVREPFSLLLDNRAATLILLRVDDHVADPGIIQFTVVFQGPGDLRLSDGTYRVTHATAGTTMLYLRPKGRDDRYTYYEAPFSLLSENALVTEPPPVRDLRRFEQPLYTPRP